MDTQPAPAPQAPAAPPRDLVRTTLAVVFIFLMVGGSLWVMLAFLPAIIWATMIVVATWPMLMKVQGWFKGRRGPAVAVMTLLLLLVFVLPMAVAIGTIVSNIPRITGALNTLAVGHLPGPPGWVAKVPVAGARLAERWTELAALPREELAQRVAPYVTDAARWFAAKAGGIGLTALHLLLIVAISAIMYAGGEVAAAGVLAFGRRLGGERGEGSVKLAGSAIRAVAMGVVVTAVVQSVLAGLGLLITGVPFAGALTAVALLTCIAQLGPVPVLLPAVIWLYWSGSPAWGTVLLVWMLIVGVLDNVLRPLLIKRGADLPLLLILSGVIGGLLAFGVVGLFVGPVVLAVTYTLTKAWVTEPAR